MASPTFHPFRPQRPSRDTVTLFFITDPAGDWNITLATGASFDEARMWRRVAVHHALGWMSSPNG